MSDPKAWTVRDEINFLVLMGDDQKLGKLNALLALLIAFADPPLTQAQLAAMTDPELSAAVSATMPRIRAARARCGEAMREHLEKLH